MPLATLHVVVKYRVAKLNMKMPGGNALKGHPFVAAIAAAYMGMFPVCVWAAGPLNDQGQSSLITEFKLLDSNHDGVLSHKEAGHDEDIAPRFSVADDNHDGKLTEQEYTVTKSEVQQARMKAFLDDSTVTAKVKMAIVKDGGIQGLGITVKTHQGMVVLSGAVQNQLQLHRAIEIASGIRGVVHVKNNLNIERIASHAVLHPVLFPLA